MHQGSLVAAASLCVAFAACGGSESEPRDERAAQPAPHVRLSSDDRAAWAPWPPDGSRVPVLVYDRVPPDDFARHMTLLDHAGYETISLDDFVRFVQREPVNLPPRPLLLTFADARLDTWAGSDAILRRLGLNAVLFVEVGPIEGHDPEVLTWAELDRVQRSGRWDVQLQSGTGDRWIRWGPEPGDVGPFYAYRGSEEVLGGWRERVFSDITYGEQQLAHHVRGYRPLAFAPPSGNYGQVRTNDRHIPREFLARARLSFDVVFTQDRSGFAEPGATNPLGRIQVTPEVTAEQLQTILASG
jgi:peptidoglycan/xylan/chitin deacetylase (PgdA/CDA1 family)